MNRKKSVIVLLLSLVLTALLGFTAIKGWGPTGTGSMGNIRTGLDLSGGVSITYQAVEDNPLPGGYGRHGKQNGTACAAVQQ